MSSSVSQGTREGCTRCSRTPRCTTFVCVAALLACIAARLYHQCRYRITPGLPPGPGSRRRNSLMSRAATTRARTRGERSSSFLDATVLPSRDRLLAEGTTGVRLLSEDSLASSIFEGDPLLFIPRAILKTILRSSFHSQRKYSPVYGGKFSRRFEIFQKNLKLSK